MNVINFNNYRKERVDTIKANVTNNILQAFTEDYTLNLVNNGVNLEDPLIAFDVATIQFLMRGMAHRSQGETHPSQIILDSLKEKIVG